jgi:preprotein translocase subunit SecG
MRDSALQPPIQGGKSASEITSAVKKRTYFQRLTRIVGFVTLINEIFLSKAQTVHARKASKPQTAPRSKAG